MVKILISNASILTMSAKHDLFINNGYVFIKDGVIEAVGKGEVPEEYQYPELLISGRGRLVMPGFSSGFTGISLYPLRYGLRSLSRDRVINYLSTLTRTDVYYISILALTELLFKGITSLMVVDIFPDDIARAANDVGVPVTLSSPINLELPNYDPLHEFELVVRRWHNRVEDIYAALTVYHDVDDTVLSRVDEFNVKLFVVEPRDVSALRRRVSNVSNLVLVDPSEGDVSEFNVVRTSSTLNLWRPFQGFGVGVSASYSILNELKLLARSGHSPLDILVSATSATTSLIGFNHMSCIEERRKANVIILNASEPPGWPIPNTLNAVLHAVIEGGLRIETVVIGDNIVIDGGEVLSVGTDLIKKAISRIEGIIKNYY